MRLETPCALKTSTAVTVEDGCRIDCTRVGDSVECELGDRQHNIMITFMGGSLAEFVRHAQGLLDQHGQVEPPSS